MHDALVSRYGLVLVIFWIGAMKFTSCEANGIRPLANSPLMGWLYRFLSVQQFSDSLGVVEMAYNFRVDRFSPIRLRRAYQQMAAELPE